MAEFPTLQPLARKRLAKRGIDPERSYREFQAEIRVQPPPALLAILFGPHIPAGARKGLHRRKAA